MLLEAILNALALLVGHRLQDIGKYSVLCVGMIEQPLVLVLSLLCVLGLLNYLNQDSSAISKEPEKLVLLEDLGERI